MTATTAVSDYASALDFLLRRINYERTTNIPYRSGEFKLDRMRRLLALLGDPQVGLKAVHIAGTKGKGSTAAMMATVLQSAGYRTGLYTSPHLQRIEERIAIDGRLCPEEHFVSLAAELETATARIEQELPIGESETGPTFFEITTAMAFLHFARANVEAAVLEVGLGGRLDSTNVCSPEVCVITSISFDHMKQLGHTLAAIAGEKAGIIKAGIPIVSGVIDDEPRQVIAARAAEVNAPLVQRGVDYGFRVQGSGFSGQEPEWGECFDYWQPAIKPQYKLTGVRLGLIGSHQAANGAAAIAAVNCLREGEWSINDEALRHGLAAARCPGRIEVMNRRPTVVLDVAHNPASIEALLKVLDERFTAGRRILIFASSKDKDYASMLRLLVGACDVVFLTKYIDNPRAMEPEALLGVAQQLIVAGQTVVANRRMVLHATARPADAWRLASAMAGNDDLVCVTGSFFLAAELRPLLIRRVETTNSTNVTNED